MRNAGVLAGRMRQRRPGVKGAQGALLLMLLALVSSCVMPAQASRRPAGEIALVLDDPIRFDPVRFAADVQAVDRFPPLEQGATLLLPGKPAAARIYRGRSAQDVLRASLCLTAAIYYEAGNEPVEGQRAVAQVVLNRVSHPAYPDTVCDVVYQGTERGDTLCQFTFACDGSLGRAPTAAGWARARRVALAALAGAVYPDVGLSTHYHTLAVNPGWNRSLTPAAIVGAHIFYRWPGGAGSPGAFHAVYAGREPVPAPRAPMPSAPGIATAGQPFRGLAVVNPGSGFPARELQPAAPADERYVPGALPESEVLPAYRHSGQWIAR